MKIKNRALNVDNFKFNFYAFSAAREAFKYILRHPSVNGRKILMPAFIGQSVREGSGVFDPIRETKADYEFYKMDSALKIDLQDLSERLKKHKKSALVLIHYWGFVDPKYDEIKKMAKDYDCLVIEDFAHGLFTFFKKPVLDFDFGFFSLHKMFAYPDGGVLISKNQEAGLREYDSKFYEYNLEAIANKRIENYDHVLSKLKKLNSPYVEILRENFGHSVPQTFPIALKSNQLKETLYFKMNEAGFGVVSLYHQLIDEVDASFSNERSLSSRILNLPIHQDAEKKDLEEMVDFLAKVIDEQAK